jgi:hypothetical protein
VANGCYEYATVCNSGAMFFSCSFLVLVSVTRRRVTLSRQARPTAVRFKDACSNPDAARLDHKGVGISATTVSRYKWSRHE